MGSASLESATFNYKILSLRQQTWRVQVAGLYAGLSCHPGLIPGDMQSSVRAEEGQRKSAPLLQMVCALPGKAAADYKGSGWRGQWEERAS
jgi:hypothetical protein